MKRDVHGYSTSRKHKLYVQPARHLIERIIFGSTNENDPGSIISKCCKVPKLQIDRFPLIRDQIEGWKEILHRVHHGRSSNSEAVLKEYRKYELYSNIFGVQIHDFENQQSLSTSMKAGGYRNSILKS